MDDQIIYLTAAKGFEIGTEEIVGFILVKL
jgi:hypothetical protein